MNDPWKITALDSPSSSHLTNIKLSPKNHIKEKLEGVHKFSEITQLHQWILWCSSLQCQPAGPCWNPTRVVLEATPAAQIQRCHLTVPDRRRFTEPHGCWPLHLHISLLQPAAPGLVMEVKEGNLESFYSAFPSPGMSTSTSLGYWKTVKEFTMQRSHSLRRSETHSSLD